MRRGHPPVPDYFCEEKRRVDSMQVTKAFAAVLVSGIAFMGASLVGQALVSPRHLETSVIKIEAPGAAPAATAAAPAEPSLEALLATADPKKGQADAQAAGCVACHSFNEGGKAGVGPNLYGIIGAPHGHMEGFAYSDALKSKTGPWTYAELNEWLKKPAAYAPGTKMTYAGLPDATKRAEIIDWLRTLSANPQPLPAVPAGSGWGLADSVRSQSMISARLVASGRPA